MTHKYCFSEWPCLGDKQGKDWKILYRKSTIPPQPGLLLFPFILETITEVRERGGHKYLKEFHVQLLVTINIWPLPTTWTLFQPGL